MEDYELVTRLRKCGNPAIIPHALEVSGRRWRNVGFVRTLLTNQVHKLLVFLAHVYAVLALLSAFARLLAR